MLSEGDGRRPGCTRTWSGPQLPKRTCRRVLPTLSCVLSSCLRLPLHQDFSEIEACSPLSTLVSVFSGVDLGTCPLGSFPEEAVPFCLLEMLAVSIGQTASMCDASPLSAAFLRPFLSCAALLVRACVRPGVCLQSARAVTEPSAQQRAEGAADPAGAGPRFWSVDAQQPSPQGGGTLQDSLD